MGVGRFLVCVLFLLTSLFAQQEPSQPKPDTFFAGTVSDLTTEKVSVSRVVSGKKEEKTFRITPDTKVEGKLRAKIRVTVRYITDEEGDTATLIVVRPPAKK